MVKTICILAGQSGCSRAVADPDLQIRGGGEGGHPDPDIKGESGLKNIFLIIFD